MFNASKKNARLYFDIIQQLYYGKILSCADLSNIIHKSIPLVTKALNYLIETGFVEEKGYAPSSGGRRPLMYAVKKDRLYVVTVAMDQLSTRISIINLFNEYVSDIKVFDLKLKDNNEALQNLTDIIDEYIKNSGINKENLIGVGIGMPGYININEGINYSYLSNNEENIPKYISSKIKLPVFIDNDSSLIALSELKFGIAKDIKDCLVINYGWGIGLGMIINGQIFRGNNGFAGEFSHIAIKEDGKLCSCGKQGCLEAEASLLAIAEDAITGLNNGRKSNITYKLEDNRMALSESIMALANKGDQYAIELISEAAFKLGKGLSFLIHIINPKAFIISGKGVKVAKLLLAPIQQALNQNCNHRIIESTDILVSDIGFDAELIGSAILVMENFQPKN